MEFEKKKWVALSRTDQDAALMFVPPTFDQTMADDFRRCVDDVKAGKAVSEFDLGKL